MENEEAQALPSSMQQEKGLVWLEGWFDLRAALTASGVGRMRPLIERAMHELEDSDYPYRRSLGAEIRTALQDDGRAKKTSRQS
jgi:hypothetical protein